VSPWFKDGAMGDGGDGGDAGSNGFVMTPLERRTSLLSDGGGGSVHGGDGGGGAAAGPSIFAYVGGLISVGRCRLTVSQPVLKTPMVSALETRI
jgi:hypothetical protein